jgi:hypothetical protein
VSHGFRDFTLWSLVSIVYGLLLRLNIIVVGTPQSKAACLMVARKQKEKRKVEDNTYPLKASPR